MACGEGTDSKPRQEILVLSQRNLNLPAVKVICVTINETSKANQTTQRSERTQNMVGNALKHR